IDRLKTITSRAFQTSSTGIPAIGEPGSSSAAGLTVSLAPITSTTSVPGQSARHRVDAEADVDALLAQLLRHLRDGVLRLRDGHAVAGGDHDRGRVGEQVGDVVGLDLPVLAVVAGLTGDGAV